MRYVWDAAKNRANILDHKIDFADVPSVFNGPMLVELDEREDYGEDRWIGMGLLHNVAVVVVFTEPRHDTIRIVSARKANKHERTRYEQALRN